MPAPASNGARLTPSTLKMLNTATIQIVTAATPASAVPIDSARDVRRAISISWATPSG